MHRSIFSGQVKKNLAPDGIYMKSRQAKNRPVKEARMATAA